MRRWVVRCRTRAFDIDGMRMNAERLRCLAGSSRDGAGHPCRGVRRIPSFRDTISSISPAFHEDRPRHWDCQYTADFADIMYFFGYDKGDVREYFGRYRRKLHDRSDIAKNSGMSMQDRTRLIQLLK